MNFTEPQIVADAIKKAENILVLAGQASSGDSGIPTMEGFPTSSWSGIITGWFSMPFYTSNIGWNMFPNFCWKMFNANVREPAMRSGPNTYHSVLGALQNKKVVRVITTTVDGMHQRAGIPAQNVAEIRGSFWHCTCSQCKTILQSSFPANAGAVGYQPKPVPFCTKCEAPPKPSIALEVSEIPPDERNTAEVLLREARGEKTLVLIVGHTGREDFFTNILDSYFEGFPGTVYSIGMYRYSFDGEESRNLLGDVEYVFQQIDDLL